MQFFLNILKWLIVAIPATWTNSWLTYVQSKLAIAYRTRLTQEVMGQYFGNGKEGPDGKVYYKLCKISDFHSANTPNHPQANLDDRIKNPDQ